MNAMTHDLQFYIDGAWTDPHARRVLDVIDPATEEAFTQIALGDADDVDGAVAAAKRAFPSYSRASRQERLDLLDSIIAVYKRRAEEMAQAISREMGAPIAMARQAQVGAGLSHLVTAREVLRDFQFDEVVNKTVITREPMGVCGLITPWNWPMNQIGCKVGPALAAGCTMVLKPATQTPLSALALGELAVRAGIPAGVFNVVTGSASAIGGEMTTNPAVRKVTFTGSTEVGKKLMVQCAGTVKKLSLELGGNAPFIVFDDADLDAAVQGAIASKYRNTGQTCVCANRLLVQEGVYDEFAKKLTVAVAKLRVGDGLKGATDQGPLIDEKAIAKVEEHVADAVGKGAKVAAGGKRHSLGGTFYEPTILTGVTPGMLVAREETFGPVAPLFKFKTEAEAIKMANDTEFGLAAYMYTRDLARSWRVSEAIEYGIVGLNTGIISTEVAPFGGVKESGTGREGSKYGILDYTELKYICVGGVS
jgi:succinate-semialdehyde dehydrogenase/glutarate-semialdehyde dehydrogenase